MNVGGGPGDREHHQPQAGGGSGGHGLAGGSGFQAASHINSIQRQQLQQPQRRSSIEATTNPSSKADSGLIPQPPPPPSIHDIASASQEAAGGCRLGLGHTGGQRGVPNTMAIQAGGGRHPLVDFCTLRRPASNNRPPPRSVQFADQQNVSNSTDLLMLL